MFTDFPKQVFFLEIHSLLLNGFFKSLGCPSINNLTVLPLFERLNHFAGKRVLPLSRANPYLDGEIMERVSVGDPDELLGVQLRNCSFFRGRRKTVGQNRITRTTKV